MSSQACFTASRMPTDVGVSLASRAGKLALGEKAEPSEGVAASSGAAGVRSAGMRSPAWSSAFSLTVNLTFNVLDVKVFPSWLNCACAWMVISSVISMSIDDSDTVVAVALSNRVGTFSPVL